MQIITNWQARPLQCLADMPEKKRADFDYIESDDEYSPRFVCYRGEWHDVFDTQRIEPDNGRAHRVGFAMRVHPGSPLAHFDAIESDTYFSGLLYRLLDDDSVIVGRYFT